MDIFTSVMWIMVTLLLVVANGFFVAAEFALVKVRPSRVSEMARQGRAGSRTAVWLLKHLDNSLSACQLGITVASLALGWVGEPAIARLLEPVFASIGITSEAVIHGLSFVIGFGLITAAHLVVGEQVPKIYAIRRPEPMVQWCALPLRWFYVISLPFLKALSGATTVILRWFGVHGASEHDTHSEEEIRTLLSHAHAQGELTRSEHRLLDAIFEFDDTVCRQIMLPRNQVDFLDISDTKSEMMEAIRRTMHTRYPVCDRSLDNIVGFLHLKDLIRSETDGPSDLRELVRPPRYIPEAMPLGKLLGLFKASKQHLAFVVDEHGTVIGIVTLENVLEAIVGDVQDEFDDEMPLITPDGPGRFLVEGSASIGRVSQALNVELSSDEVETIGGLLTQRLGRVAAVGDQLQLGTVEAEIVEMRRARPSRIRMIVAPPGDSGQKT